MIKIVIIYFTLLTAFDASAQIVWHECLKPEDNSKVRALVKRAGKGDAGAFADASKLEAKVAVPLLFFQYIHRRGDGNKSAEVEAARAAIRKVKGHGRYLEHVLSRIHSEHVQVVDGFQEYDVYEALGGIGTMEAAAVIAPYLFRSGPDYGPPRPGEDQARLVYSEMAAFELGRMNLPDAPVTGKPMFYGLQELEKWKQWAIAHKLAGPRR